MNKPHTPQQAEALCPTYSKCAPAQAGNCKLAHEFAECLRHREELRHIAELEKIGDVPERYWFSKS